MSQCVLACSLATHFNLLTVDTVASVSSFPYQLMRSEVGFSVFRKPKLFMANSAAFFGIL